MEPRNPHTAINPFTPGFGQVPAYLAGREYLLNEIKTALASPSFSPDLTTLFIGARGTGKTALLSYLSEYASGVGWVTVGVSATSGMLEDIIEETKYRANHLLETTSGPKIKEVTAGGFGIAWENVLQQEGNWRTRMNQILDQLEKYQAGLLITVDEVNPAVDEMIRLVSVYQHFVREGRRVALMLAGLPSMVSGLVSNEYVSFLRRARHRKLDRIPDHEIADAFRRTIEQSERTVGDVAVEKATQAIDGFPYMLQLVGFQSWRRNPANTMVSMSDVEEGIRMATAEMRTKVLQATYGELSKGDIRFVNAMLDSSDRPTLAEVASHMGVKSNYASKYKTRLMEAGVIGETPLNTLRFELPRFEDYAREMKEAL